jgi:hypothetical protein
MSIRFLVRQEVGMAYVFLVLEAVITEIAGVKAVRRRDPQSGMAILELVDE